MLPSLPFTGLHTQARRVVKENRAWAVAIHEGQRVPYIPPTPGRARLRRLGRSLARSHTTGLRETAAYSPIKRSDALRNGVVLRIRAQERAGMEVVGGRWADAGVPTFARPKARAARRVLRTRDVFPRLQQSLVRPKRYHPSRRPLRCVAVHRRESVNRELTTSLHGASSPLPTASAQGERSS